MNRPSLNVKMFHPVKLIQVKTSHVVRPRLSLKRGMLFVCDCVDPGRREEYSRDHKLFITFVLELKLRPSLARRVFVNTLVH